MREICLSGSEGGGAELKRLSLPLSKNRVGYQALRAIKVRHAPRHYPQR
jgi:hypothetical protein